MADMNIRNNADFSTTRGLSIPRSTFDMSNSVTFTCNIGDLVPVEYWEILPGDTVEISINSLTRLQTLLFPVMDDIHMDVYSFFVPNRLVMDDWELFMGENSKGPYYPTENVFIPHIVGSPVAKTTADYFGIPINYTNQSTTSNSVSFNALPFRAYGLIWNEWFRDQQLQSPLLIDKSSLNHTYDVDNPIYGGKLLKASKYHDYFTSALPKPQAGEPVQINIADVKLPVLPNGIENIDINQYSETAGLMWTPLNSLSDAIEDNSFYSINLPTNFNLNDGGVYTTRAVKNSGRPTTTNFEVVPSNLFAFSPDGVNVTNINDLRLAFATQQFLERDNIGGQRYIEIIRNHFGVKSADGRLQRPELVGYFHDTLNISQVVQNSETGNTPLGDVAGMSVTFGDNGSVSKSFTEHGYLITLACFRYKHSYQNGLSRDMARKDKFDFYFPIFANIGEQPILKSEIYYSDNKTDNNKVFGYQEAWAEYRFKQNRVSGEVRSSFKTPLDYLTFADSYSSMPTLSSDWIVEDGANVDRAVAVSQKLADTVMANFYFDTQFTRSLPVYSIAGLTRM